VLFVSKGKFDLLYRKQVYPLNLGETIFLPAGLGTYHLSGEGEVLMITDN
jgi:mannose-6-phosphate isomerase class I